MLLYQSKANFLWMKLNDEIENKIDDNKIYIRKFNINNKKYCRISIGTVEENNKLLEVISSCVKH